MGGIVLLATMQQSHDLIEEDVLALKHEQLAWVMFTLEVRTFYLLVQLHFHYHVFPEVTFWQEHCYLWVPLPH